MLIFRSSFSQVWKNLSSNLAKYLFTVSSSATGGRRMCNDGNKEKEEVVEEEEEAVSVFRHLTYRKCVSVFKTHCLHECFWGTRWKKLTVP